MSRQSARRWCVGLLAAAVTSFALAVFLILKGY